MLHMTVFEPGHQVSETMALLGAWWSHSTLSIRV